MTKTLLCGAIATACCFLMSAAQGNRAARIDALFQQCGQPAAPGASVLVVRGGKVLFKKSYGLADVEEHIRATPSTNYRLAPVTKQFTAMGIMILADRGKLNLQQHLSEFFPDLPPYTRKVSLRQMLNHQSGLPDYEDAVPAGTAAVVTSPAQQLSDRDVLDFLKKKDNLLVEPGSQYRYSNTGCVVLGLIIGKVAGTTYPQFLKVNILDRLGMTDTVAHVEGIDKVRNRAYGYSRKGDGFVRTDQSPTSATLGDGGVYSSVQDLMKWDQALYGAKLVKRATFQEAITPAPLAGGKPTSYGFGWEISRHGGSLQMAHGGTTLGFRTYIQRIPDKRFTVIVLTNRSDLNPTDLVRKITEFFVGE
jgi:CubicO group peptidase (beta-lactamase class C family)